MVVSFVIVPVPDSEKPAGKAPDQSWRSLLRPRTLVPGSRVGARRSCRSFLGLWAWRLGESRKSSSSFADDCTTLTRFPTASGEVADMRRRVTVELITWVSVT